jgi:hypothetical protein
VGTKSENFWGNFCQILSFFPPTLYIIVRDSGIITIFFNRTLINMTLINKIFKSFKISEVSDTGFWKIYLMNVEYALNQFFTMLTEKKLKKFGDFSSKYSKIQAFYPFDEQFVPFMFMSGNGHKRDCLPTLF